MNTSCQVVQGPAAVCSEEEGIVEGTKGNVGRNSTAFQVHRKMGTKDFCVVAETEENTT